MNGIEINRKRKALIVEDNEMNREMLSALLEDEYYVLTAENGQIGLEILSEQYRNLSIVFLDVEMPICNGYEFLEKIKNDALLNSLPIIVTTSSNDPEEEIRCLNLGASDFVSKPYNPKVVLGRARSLIKLHESIATLSVIEFDKLTGFYTMPAFYHHTSIMLKNESKKNFDLFVIDINDFKIVNNVYGEKGGDAVLIHISNAIREYLPNCIVSRQNDKFYILNLEEYRLTKKQFREFSGKVVKLSPIPNLPVKCGCYFNVDTSQPISILCDRVQMAITKIKRDMTRTFVIYDDSIQEKRIKNQKMESDFKDAIKNKEFIVFYQPKVDPVSEKVVAAEALIRWKKDGKMIPPSEFIPLFEQDGLIQKLDEYVFKTVCEFIQQRIKNGKKVVPISVNLSRMSVYFSGTIEKYKKIVQMTNVPIELVPIEITESATADGQRVLDLTKELLTAGFTIHMDDFGSGYSSLSSLVTIPFGVIKFDKSLIDQIGTEKGDTILWHTMMIAKDFEMKTVAEGVEEIEQLEFLKKAKCDMIQGFYYSAPKNKEDFEKMLEESFIFTKNCDKKAAVPLGRLMNCHTL